MSLLQRYFHRPQTVPLRRANFQLHLWLGIIVSLYMATIGLTGSLLVFRQEFDALRLPKRWRESRTTFPTDAATVIARLNAAYPGVKLVSLTAPTSSNPTFVATLLGRRRMTVACDPSTGDVLGPMPPRAAWLTFVSTVHETLLIRGSGRMWNGVGAACLLFLAATGLVNWWPGIRSWRRALKVDFRLGWRRINFDLHSATGFWALPLVLVWGITGVYFAWPEHAFRLVNSWSPIVSARPPSVAATPTADAAEPDVDALIARAAIIDPGTRWSGIFFPYGRRAPMEIIMRRSQRGGREYEDTVYFDPYNGEHLATWRYGVNQSLGDWLIWLQIPLHVGTSWGLAVKVIWAAGGLALPLLAVTAWVMYWNRVLRHTWRGKRKGGSERTRPAYLKPGA